MLGNDRSESSLHSEDDFSHRFSITLKFRLRSMSTINLDRISHLLRGTNELRDNLFGSSSVHSNAPVSLLASRVTSVRHSALRWQRDPLFPSAPQAHGNRISAGAPHVRRLAILIRSCSRAVDQFFAIPSRVGP